MHWVYICRIEWLSLQMLISYWYQYYRCGIHLKRKTALLPLGLLVLVWRHLCCPLFRCHFIDFIKNELSRPFTNLLEKFSYRRVQETVTNSFLNFESSRVQLSDPLHHYDWARGFTSSSVTSCIDWVIITIETTRNRFVSSRY